MFGLFFFALLLQQIQLLNKTVGQRNGVRNERKNSLVAFLRSNNCSAFDATLTKDTVRFLNFQNSVLSGNAFDGSSKVFDGLSPTLKDRIHIAVNRPVLEKVRMFGWNPVDWDEEAELQARFNKIDTEQDGSLDRAEVSALFALEQIELSAGQFNKVFDEMDWNSDGGIDFSEFRLWWNMKKFGRPTMDKCPEVQQALLEANCVASITQSDLCAPAHCVEGSSRAQVAKLIVCRYF